MRVQFRLHMKTCFLLIAHAPLASALRACALHVFPECEAQVLALDVPAYSQPAEMREAARSLMNRSRAAQVLLFSDVVGATPCNVAQSLVQDGGARLIAGVNLPMLLRAVNYRDEDLPDLVERALSGGAQGMVELRALALSKEQ